MAKGEAGRGHPRADRLVRGARQCVGTAFRPQGRGVGGIDCLGVILAAAKAAGIGLVARCDYSLVGGELTEVIRGLQAQGCSGIAVAHGVAGDVLVATPAVGQIHFALLTDTGLIEAHAGLRRVIERPLKLEDVWQSCWRLPLGDN